MIYRDFPKEDLVTLTYGGRVDGYTIKECKIDGARRWFIQYRLVFTYQGKHYLVYYDRGATEYQDKEPFEDCGEMIACVEVRPYEVRVTKYKPIETVNDYSYDCRR